MTSQDVHDARSEIHGLNYPPTFLESLPVLQPSSFIAQATPATIGSPSAPAHATAATPTGAPPELPYTIRALTAKQFGEIHNNYLTTHAPDSVIFPFLHGLEGENDQQNAFFATAARVDGACAAVPRFRGLVWVASDEDEMEDYERAMQQGRLAGCSGASGTSPLLAPRRMLTQTRPPHDADAAAMSSDIEDDDDALDDDEDDDYSTASSQSDLDHFAGMPMDVDEHVDLGSDGEFDVAGGRSMSMDVDDDAVEALRALTDHSEGVHMHPVIHHRPALSAIDTGTGKGVFLLFPFCDLGSWFSSHPSVRPPFYIRW